jgi:hypothetical protein
MGLLSPVGVNEFAGIAAIAEQLRDARAAGDQRLVDENKMTQAAAADRLRVATALAADWRRVADQVPRPQRVADDAEILAMISQALPAAISRRDKAYKTLVANAPQYRHYDLDELWALSDRCRSFSEAVQDDIVEYVRPWLQAQNVANGLGAMLWWQRRRGVESIHFLVDTTIALRERARLEGEGRLAA